MKKRPLSKPVRDWLQIYGACHPSERFHFVTIHPLAGEAESGGMLGCDLYWAIRPHKKAFVSILIDLTTPPKAFFNPGEGEVPFDFHVVTHQRPLTSLHLEAALSFLDAWYSKRSAFDSRMQVADHDLCA